MKSVSVTQPSASLLAIGAIKEIRSGRYTAYRGPVAIYALPFFSLIERMRLRDSPFRFALAEHYEPEDLAIGELPTGRIVSVGSLEDCIEEDSHGELITPDSHSYIWRFDYMHFLYLPIACECPKGIADLPERIAERLGVLV